MNFDEYIDRREYPTLKWRAAFLNEHFGNPDAIPMSVADMDFKAPPAVIARLGQRAAHGVYGYGYRPEGYFGALLAWYRDRYGWEIAREHLVPSPSILNAMAILINQHSERGNGVILQPPVFFEFRMVIRRNHRRVVKNPLRLVDGHYEIDFEDLERKAADPNNKILILCSPHNPVGRVWQREELEQVAAICRRHGVFVIADEIHGDFALPPRQFVPYLSVADGENAAACISPAKTFNISGLVEAFTIIPNAAHRQAFRAFMEQYFLDRVHVFGVEAVEAAYRDGGAWLDALLAYLRGQVDFIRAYLQRADIGVSLIEPEGTFLAWLDFRGLGLEAKALEQFLAHEAQIALAQGYWFGREGAGFGRMTIACPRQTLERALNNLRAAVLARRARGGT